MIEALFFFNLILRNFFLLNKLIRAGLGILAHEVNPEERLGYYMV